MPITIDRVALLRDGFGVPIQWNNDVIGMNVNRIHIAIDVSGEPLPDAIEVKLSTRAANRLGGSATVAMPVTWRVPRDGTKSRYVLRRPLSDLADFLLVKTGGTPELVTIRRHGGTSDEMFRRSGSWIMRGMGQQNSTIGAESGEPALERPDAMTLLKSAGVEVLVVEVVPQQGWIMKARSVARLVRSPADVLYYTGHGGGSALKIHAPSGYEDWIRVDELGPSWPRKLDLDVLVIAGCNCLNMKYNGAAWGKLLVTGDGPLHAVLSYSSKAPTDEQAGNRIAVDFAKRMDGGSRTWVRNWLEVHQQDRYRVYSGPFACAIDKDGLWSLEEVNGRLTIAGPVSY